MKGPIALGIHWAHDAAAALCTPDGILCAIPEDRLSRIKHHYGFPRRAIRAVLDYCGLAARDLDCLALSTQRVMFEEHENRVVVGLDGAHRPHLRGALPTRLLRATKNFVVEQLVSREQRRRRLTERVKNSWGPFADRHWVLQGEFLADSGLLDPRLRHYYIHHHRAHAAAAFRLSGLEQSCVVSIDGKGDGISAATFRGEADGRMQLLRSSASTDSLGSFYQAATEALGFVPADGEYKTMGLAGLGRPVFGPNPFAGTVAVVDGVLRSRLKWRFRDYNQHNRGREVPNPLSSVAQCEAYKPLLDELPREQFAYFAQEHFQEQMLAYAHDALRISELHTLVAAGGVLLNVKANALIRDQLAPKSFFVFPDAADSGLAVGAAMEALFQAGAIKGPCPLTSPYVGHSYGDERVRSALDACASTQPLAIANGAPDLIARALCAGKVIGTFIDRLELGPRALGHRSVLADPRKNATKDRINSLLKGREWFVPFAPCVLESDAHLYWHGATEYPYMTFAVTASDYARNATPAVVHVDGTMRPQVVQRERHPWLHAVLEAFKRMSGVGLLINTSFNRHGLPMVGSPEDALEHLCQGWVDAVAIGSWYVERAGASEVHSE